MSVKPILFNTDMVRAILDGRKTVTRRLVKCTHKNAAGFYIVRNHVGEIVGVLDYDEDECSFNNYTAPPYKPSDILWVRETWAESLDDEGRLKYEYKADHESSDGWGWRPSIHMPREAARIFLRVTNVRVERLQEITIEGLQGEGALPDGYISQYTAMTEGSKWFDQWKLLWESTIKPADRDKYGWDANPWAWVIEFERCEKPEGWPI